MQRFVLILIFFSSARFRDSERNASECILLVLQRRRVRFFRFLHFPRMFQINLTLISWFFEFLVVLHTVLEHADKKSYVILYTELDLELFINCTDLL